jgi:hypothetical protein
MAVGLLSCCVRAGCAPEFFEETFNRISNPLQDFRWRIWVLFVALRERRKLFATGNELTID